MPKFVNCRCKMVLSYFSSQRRRDSFSDGITFYSFTVRFFLLVSSDLRGNLWLLLAAFHVHAADLTDSDLAESNIHLT